MKAMTAAALYPTESQLGGAQKSNKNKSPKPKLGDTKLVLETEKRWHASRHLPSDNVADQVDKIKQAELDRLKSE